MPEFVLKTNENNKAIELKLWKVYGSVEQNPHMRAFWGSVISFFLAFLGWFALAPLSLDVAESMKICENQLYPPAEYPKRLPYLRFKNLQTEKFYCRYGKLDPLTDCREVPADIMIDISATAEEKSKYDPSVLASAGCVCTGGTECKSVLANAGVASVASTIFVRVAMGTLLERFGPVNTQSGLLTISSFFVFAAAGITAPWNYTLIRFFIGCAGASFVTNQFWCSLMFAPSIVGTANATAGGWGNLGGGVTQIFMIVVLFQPFQDAGMAPDTAWRVAMIVPGTCFLITAICLKLLCWDTPTRKRFNVADTGKTTGASMWDYVEVLKDPRVVIMIFQYGACFGTELAMNNQLATHFRTYFQMKAGDSAVLAASFGGMNLFARSLGGITSDFLFTKFGFRGRIWAQFVGLFLEAIFLFAFGCVNNEQPWYVALGVLIVFSIFTQMSEGTSYGIVPFMNKKQLAVVSALVGAGGNLGAVIAGFCIYKPIDDELLPFRVHAGYVLFWCLLCPFYYWPEYGGMFCGPAAIAAEDSAEAAKSSSESKQAEPVEPPAQEQAKADDGAKADLKAEVAV